MKLGSRLREKYIGSGGAVDRHGQVLDLLMQKQRNVKVAKSNCFKKLLKKQGFAPRIIITDKLKSYGAAI